MKKLPFGLILSVSTFAQAPDFDAKGLFYLQDGQDKLGYFALPLKLQDSRHPSEIGISNSIENNHRIIGLKAKSVYILETKGQKQGEEYAPGTYVSVVKLQDHQLRPDYRFPVAENPTSLSFDPSQHYLTISSTTAGNEIQIFELDDFGKPIRLLPGVLHMEGGAINDLIWHPNKQYLAFIRKEDKELGLIRVVWDKNRIIRLEQVGELTKFEGVPSQGAFSKDGKSFFLLDEGDDHRKGQIFVIRLSQDDSGKHQLISRIDVGFQPRQLSLHPSGDYLGVTHGKVEAMVSIFSFKNESLEFRSEITTDGLQPASLKWDKNGKNLAISCAYTKQFGKPIGQIYFYKFSSGKLEKQSGSVVMNAGIHQMEVWH